MREAIEMSSKLPGLTPKAFCLLGLVKEKVYATKPPTIENLKALSEDTEMKICVKQ